MAWGPQSLLYECIYANSYTMCWKMAFGIFLHHDRGVEFFFLNAGQNYLTSRNKRPLPNAFGSICPFVLPSVLHTFKASSVGMQLSRSDCMFVNNGIFSASLAQWPITLILTCGYKSIFLFLMNFIHINPHIGSPVFLQKSPVFFWQISCNSCNFRRKTPCHAWDLYQTPTIRIQ